MNLTRLSAIWRGSERAEFRPRWMRRVFVIRQFLKMDSLDAARFVLMLQDQGANPTTLLVDANSYRTNSVAWLSFEVWSKSKCCHSRLATLPA